jgi:hypothetical protein
LTWAGSWTVPGGPKVTPVENAELNTLSPMPMAAIPRNPMMKKTSRIRRRVSSIRV